MESAREFFDSLPGRIDPERAGALHASYRFDVEKVGSWRLEADGARVVVTESEAPADCVVRTSEKVLLEIVRGERNPVTAYLTGKVRVEGEIGVVAALKDLLKP